MLRNFTRIKKEKKKKDYGLFAMLVSSVLYESKTISCKHTTTIENEENRCEDLYY